MMDQLAISQKLTGNDWEVLDGLQNKIKDRLGWESGNPAARTDFGRDCDVVIGTLIRMKASYSKADYLEALRNLSALISTEVEKRRTTGNQFEKLYNRTGPFSLDDGLPRLLAEHPWEGLYFVEITTNTGLSSIQSVYQALSVKGLAVNPARR